MAFVRILGGDIPLGGAVALLDTNVLVAYFHEADTNHHAAKITLEEDRRFDWIITGPVLVEASGMLTSRAGRHGVGRMYAWLSTPGTGVSIITCSEGPNEHQERLTEHTTLCGARNLDFVDAYLMRAATILRAALGRHSRVVPILTCDSDFYRGGGAGYQYGVLDFRDLASEVVEIS